MAERPPPSTRLPIGGYILSAPAPLLLVVLAVMLVACCTALSPARLRRGIRRPMPGREPPSEPGGPAYRSSFD